MMQSLAGLSACHPQIYITRSANKLLLLLKEFKTLFITPAALVVPKK
jgi:hypothetical protein